MVDRLVALRLAAVVSEFGTAGSAGGPAVAVGVGVDTAGAGALEPVSPAVVVSGRDGLTYGLREH